MRKHHALKHMNNFRHELAETVILGAGESPTISRLRQQTISYRNDTLVNDSRIHSIARTMIIPRSVAEKIKERRQKAQKKCFGQALARWLQRQYKDLFTAVGLGSLTGSLIYLGIILVNRG